MIRVAAIMLWFVAAGFGLPCVTAIRSLRAGHGLPMLMGFRAYGDGPFEQLGIHTTVSLLAAFMLVCALEGLAGWLLWGGHKSGAILAIALLPVGAVFWWGFALPIPPILAIVRTVLIVQGWQTLR